jgi:hypothetical protein
VWRLKQEWAQEYSLWREARLDKDRWVYLGRWCLQRSESGCQWITLGADKNHDAKGFVEGMREMKVTPHVAQNDTRRASAFDGRTTRHPGYQMSQTFRKRIEECFGVKRHPVLRVKATPTFTI